MGGDARRTLRRPKPTCDLGIGDALVWGDKMRLEAPEQIVLAPLSILRSQPNHRPIEQRQGPPPIEEPFRCRGVFRLCQVAALGAIELERQSGNGSATF